MTLLEVRGLKILMFSALGFSSVWSLAASACSGHHQHNVDADSQYENGQGLSFHC